MKKLKAITFINDVSTFGHGPSKFICSDFSIYYLKKQILNSRKKHDIDFLLSEVICNRILKSYKIPTPDLALVEISSSLHDYFALNPCRNSYIPTELYLGSKEVVTSDIVHSLAPHNSKRRFKRDSNPYDLLKIALFDLWVNNCDRGRSGNYNLLIQYTSRGNLYYAFDHAFCFGGLNLFLDGSLPYYNWKTKNRLYKSSFFKTLITYLNVSTMEDILESFFKLDEQQIYTLVRDAYYECPHSWNLAEEIIDDICLFLTDNKRIENIKQTMYPIIKMIR